eukprot:1158122-Pelagomonas_calceolata.AAC.12
MVNISFKAANMFSLGHKYNLVLAGISSADLCEVYAHAVLRRVTLMSMHACEERAEGTSILRVVSPRPVCMLSLGGVQILLFNSQGHRGREQGYVHASPPEEPSIEYCGIEDGKDGDVREKFVIGTSHRIPTLSTGAQKTTMMGTLLGYGHPMPPTQELPSPAALGTEGVTYVRETQPSLGSGLHGALLPTSKPA